MNSKLTSRGYIIHKNELTFKDIQKIKKDLIVSPFIPKDFPQAPSYPIYLESPNKYYLPRYYGIEMFGDPKKYTLNNGNPINLKFKGKLRDIQIDAKNKYMETIDTQIGGGIVCLSCGQGKTVLALDIISEIKLKTLIIVHKEFLANQWIDRINTYLPGARVGKIQGKVIDIHNKDICVAMLQTLSLKEFDNNVFSSFGLLIIDEVHHLSSEVFSRALLKVNLKYTLGLTATPIRSDLLTHVFLKFLGPIVYKSEKDTNNNFNLIVKHIKYNSENVKYNTVELTTMGKVCTPRIINNITQYESRNHTLINIIHHLAYNPKRNIILLSDRREHLRNLYELLDKKYNIGFYVGGMKQQLLDKTANESQIILSTYSMAAEALDIPKLNCLILSSPKVNIEQAVGRILRKKHEISPLVIDIEDHFSIFKNQYKKRSKFYKSNNYLIDNIEINDNTNFNDIKNTLDSDSIKNINIKNYTKH
jgi:superfamily II DNA or RNA helicase